MVEYDDFYCPKNTALTANVGLIYLSKQADTNNPHYPPIAVADFTSK
jgi:hypothetical protein